MMPQMSFLRFEAVADLQATVRDWRRQVDQKGLKIGFVPTMGALHDGHLTLVKTAKTMCDKVVASIFVNPLQFAPHEDFDRYPRQPDHDSELLQSAGCDAVFLPQRDMLYTPGFSSRIEVGAISEPLEGIFRPTHFSGVATVVCKLLNIVQPTHAFFGEKDYQQLAVIRRMVTDLNLPFEIVGVPIVRNHDGLALSSRNEYLTPAERAIAPRLYETLQRTAHSLQNTQDIKEILAAAAQSLQSAGFGKIDYLSLCDADTLQDIAEWNKRPKRLLVAIMLGKTRLIDNIAV